MTTYFVSGLGGGGGWGETDEEGRESCPPNINSFQPPSFDGPSAFILLISRSAEQTLGRKHNKRTTVLTEDDVLDGL